MIDAVLHPATPAASTAPDGPSPADPSAPEAPTGVKFSVIVPLYN